MTEIQDLENQSVIDVFLQQVNRKANIMIEIKHINVKLKNTNQILIRNINLEFDNGNFIITETSYSANRETATLTLSAKNYNLNESYLDIYRVAITEESEDTLTKKAITFYNQDNKTTISKEIYVNGELVNND